MVLGKSIAVVLILFGLQSRAQSVTVPIMDLKLPAIDGSIFSFKELQTNKASVLIFLSPDCPLCQNYSLTISQLEGRYAKGGIKFYGIFPGKWYSIHEIKEFSRDYKLNISMLLDSNKVLSRLIKATVTPEAIVLNNVGKVLYQGRIDNWMYAVGRKRTVITKHELSDALEAIVNKKPILVSKTQPVGCLIE